MKPGAQLIAEERERQITQDGYTTVHDDQHDCCELAKAAAWYALPMNWREKIKQGLREIHFPMPVWPFQPEDFKPSQNRIRELVKAGALIAAEIDRLQRKEGL